MNYRGDDYRGCYYVVVKCREENSLGIYGDTRQFIINAVYEAEAKKKAFEAARASGMEPYLVKTCREIFKHEADYYLREKED